MNRQSLQPSQAPAVPATTQITLQRKCDCGTHTPAGGTCPSCTSTPLQRDLTVGASDDPYEHEADQVADAVMAQSSSAAITRSPPAIRRLSSRASSSSFAAPPSVVQTIAGNGRPLDAPIRREMEGRFGHDFSQIRIHQGGSAAQSASDIQAKAYTAGNNIVFGAGHYAPETAAGRRLLAHELTHTIQQSSAEPLPAGGTVQRDPSDDEAPAPAADAAPAGDAEGIEVDPGELMLLPRAQLTLLPGDAPGVQRDPAAPATNICDTPSSMTALTSGTFLGGKTLDNYYPDLVGAGSWGANNTAGPFDNGTRAGSAVQLIGFLPMPCATSPNMTLGQTASIRRMRANGAKLQENGRPLEGQTLNDIARSGRDASTAPFRQTWAGAISMADPISGVPYRNLQSYEMQVDLTSSLTGPGGTVSATWGVTVEAAAGVVTTNTVR